MKLEYLMCIVLILICAICVPVFAAADSREDLTGFFYSANKLYEQGRYEEATAEYKKILDMGFESGPLYYNLGNAYFKIGALGKTILYYEKAKKLIPQNPELRFNDNYVQSLLEDKFDKSRKNWFVRVIEDISEFYSLGRWLGIVIVFWIVLILFIILRINFPGLKRAAKYIILTLILLLGLGVISVIVNYGVYFSPAAIVQSKEVIVRYGPGEAEVEAFVLHEGTKAAILKTEDNWCQIQLSDGKTGWLPKDSIEVI